VQPVHAVPPIGMQILSSRLAMHHVLNGALRNANWVSLFNRGFWRIFDDFREFGVQIRLVWGK
jgi:hypothetical protein